MPKLNRPNSANVANLGRNKMLHLLKKLSLTTCAVALAATASAQESPIKIGFITTLSGPAGSIGQELVDGFKLGLNKTNNKLGGRSVVVHYADDQAKPDIGRQHADKMVESDKVDILTGVNFSNVLLALAKPVLDAGVLYISANAGPSQYAGRQCHPHFFAASFQNDTTSEAMGIHMQEKQIKDVYIMAPNYPAGKDMLAGFKRYYKGNIVGEVYTTFNQLDYSAELAVIRAAKPSAVFVFYPGGMGINFIKQYAQAGLKEQIPLYTGAFVVDQSVLPAMGDAAIGVNTAAQWSEEFENAASKEFAQSFESTYGRIPSPYAASAYDLVRLLDAAITANKGRVDDKPTLRRALENVKFDSIRGNFQFNTNHFPIQDFYRTTIQKDSKGRLVNKLAEPIVRGLKDSYASTCNMNAAQ
jgi:branched-chain amino acid transport system substrate-binding protein